MEARASLDSEKATNHQVPEAPGQGRGAIPAMVANGFASATMACIVENIFEEAES